MALLLVLSLRPVALRENHRMMKDVIGCMLVLAVGLLVFAWVFPIYVDVDADNGYSCLKNAYTMIGSVIGVAVVYHGERKFVNFDTKACWWAQILKVVLGLGLVLLVKEGLRAPLELAMDVYVARAVRYFLIVIAAGLVWPMSFKYFSKLGVKK